jgi:putative ABC transport system ATP-binding protein
MMATTNMSGKAVVRVDELRFRWPGAAADCIDIDALQIEPGEHVFLHGPSGSGKSTLLGLLGGVLSPTHGRLGMLDRDLGTMTPAARDRFRADHVGFIFQQFNLISYLSVLDNVLLPCRFSARRRERAAASGGSALAAAGRLLERLGMDGELRHRTVTQLSVGQQQRVAAARALLGRPEIIIADEPTSALDAELQAAFVSLLLDEAAAADATVLFVSHDHRLARGFVRTLALPAVNRVAAGVAP